MDVAELMELTPDQARAAQEAQRDVLLAAGAGSGKTRTLVARYMWLLAKGVDPRAIVAITFTEKAAREMRNRVREAVRLQANRSQDEQRARWQALQARMDAARIGTIHSFCAEILRAHPARAGIDPAFEVIEEGAGSALKAEIVDEVLARAAEDRDLVQLFADLSTRSMRLVLEQMLVRRLELHTLLQEEQAGAEREQAALGAAFSDFLEAAEAGPLQEMQELAAAGELAEDAGGTLAPQIEQLLEAWQRLQKLRAESQWLELALALFRARRELIKRGAGKKGSRAKRALAELQSLYDERLNPWLGGQKSTDEPPDPELEARLPQVTTRLRRLGGLALESYRSALRKRAAVDFDDLEAGAARLLAEPQVRQKWRRAIEHVLVDEFQDTNDRQRQIVEALAPVGRGRLFVVGDARQSIYRFRGADVTVFRTLSTRVEEQGGLAVQLDETFRAHRSLLRSVDSVVAPVMGSEASGPDYQVPYTPLRAVRERNEPGDGPYLEFVFGGGERADEARPQAAKALAGRLLELRRAGHIRDWGQCALLFRASTAFPAYEAALEAAAVPYVTVAGRGFYDRPEVRDLLNALRALADPADDLALAGFLRSPAIGLSDAAITALRQGPDGLRSFERALEDGLDELPPDQRARAERARAILAELRPQVDRMPVAELLKALVDRLDLRAALASSQSRLWRNVDKLLQDALTSELVRVHAFLDYLRTLRAVGAREGEAPAEAEGSLQLMTIHKAKGLEFDLVVLADASRRPGGRGEPLYLRQDTGLAVRLDRVDADPLRYRLAKARDDREAQAEEDRLLYVAATRARERLLINGHLTPSKSGWGAAGQLQEILQAVGLDESGLVPGSQHEQVDLPAGGLARLWFAPDEYEVEQEAAEAVEWPLGAGASLLGALEFGPGEQLDEKSEEQPERPWRASAERAYAPAAAVGRMVHAAAAQRVRSGSQRARRVLESTALSEGLVDPRQREQAVAEADELLGRLQDAAIWREIEAADEAHHELPYSWQPPGRAPETGMIDVLYRHGDEWRLLDFKTDELRDEQTRQQARAQYEAQIKRYLRAAASLLGERVTGNLVFLDDMGGVGVYPVE